MPRPLILRGAPVVAALRDDLRRSTEVLTEQTGARPTLATVLVGDDPSALAYRRSIVRSLDAIGIGHAAVDLAAASDAAALVAALQRLNADPSVSGILVLMPLPPPLSPELVLDTLSPLKDVDGITPANAGRLHMGLPAIKPSTPEGGIELLDHYGIELAGRHAVVIGRSNVVGRPLATMLTQRNATVTLCHRQTRDLGAHTRQADVVAVAAGCPGLLKGGMIREGAVVLDFGVNAVDGKLVGDTDAGAIAQLAGAYSPVPGGTGPVTAMVLARNVLAAAYAALGDDVVARDDIRQ